MAYSSKTAITESMRINTDRKAIAPAFIDQRTSTSAQLQQQKMIQRKTEIQHTTGTYSYHDHRDASRKDQNVGVEMKAYLDPAKAIRGSETGGPQKEFITSLRKTFPNDNMIRGHLLNHDLGGFGVEQNLFPITSSANGVHLRTVEYGVKQALVNANAQDKGVFYHVKVSGERSDANDSPVSVFECKANYLNDVEDHSGASIGDEILSVNVTSTPKKSGPKRAAGLRGSAAKPGGQSVGNFKHSAGLATWKHSGSGVSNFKHYVEQGAIKTTTESVDEEVAINKDTAFLYLDEHGEEINGIFDLLLDLAEVDDIESLTDEDFNLLDPDSLNIIKKYGEVIAWLEKQGIDPLGE